jgi:hypothetical protein
MEAGRVLVLAVVVVLAFVAGLFVDQRPRLAILPAPYWVQIVVSAVILGVIGVLVGYFDEGQRGFGMLLGIAILSALLPPAVLLGNQVHDLWVSRLPR